MKYHLTEVSELDDWTLTIAYENCNKAEKQREEASKHPKFNVGNKRMEFPPVNPEFIKLKNEIIDEMKKRELI